MAKAILAIPEENLIEVIRVIRMGLKCKSYISNETEKALKKWCIEQETYIVGGNYDGKRT